MLVLVTLAQDATRNTTSRSWSLMRPLSTSSGWMPCSLHRSAGRYVRCLRPKHHDTGKVRPVNEGSISDRHNGMQVHLIAAVVLQQEVFINEK
jgi:hypothetical protein